jgi:hypothetical protein
MPMCDVKRYELMEKSHAWNMDMRLVEKKSLSDV